MSFDPRNNQNLNIDNYVEDDDEKIQFKNDLKIVKFKKNLIQFLFEWENLDFMKDFICKGYIFYDFLNSNIKYVHNLLIKDDFNDFKNKF